MDDASEEMKKADRAAEANAELRPVAIGREVVTRPGSAATETVYSLLRYLRGQGLSCVPDPIDVVGGVERLSFLDGESGSDGWYHQHGDAGLASAARLLRIIHDAGQHWTPPIDAVWGAPPVPGTDLVYSHGDPGPWNFVWRDREAVGLLDWDFLHPAPRLDDIAYALQWFTPMRSDALALEWHHFPQVPNRRHRIRVFLDAYGDLPNFDVVAVVTARMQATSDLVRSLAEEGEEPQRTWVEEGAFDAMAKELSWVHDHSTSLI